MEFDSQRLYLANCDAEHAGVSRETSFQAVKPCSQDVIVPVVLSGGGGSRLWPFSTKETPKQFLPLVDNKTLFEEALDRVRDRLRFSAPIVVGSIQHAELCQNGLSADGEAARLILEPCARNTAPAIVMAAIVAKEVHGDDALILVMPSDHVIEDVAEFHEAIDAGVLAARAGRLVTFGVRPTGPDTGYGYLKTGADVPDAPGVRDVLRFVEKPQLEVAEAMVADGQHLWNAGIFLFQAATLLDEAAKTCPAIAEIARSAIAVGHREGIRIIPDAGLLAECPAESIDYAVMELSSRVAVVPMSPGWSDLGSWDALATMLGTGSQVGPITTVDCESCYIRSDGLQVAALGVRDLIIVASGARLLILPRGRSQEVKKLLSAMDSMAA
jgi:mannose-1-phosphate guanylyltransferase/mannose-1-phosphate guanylyltransferase/mannose-6-phosphate isomerase